MTISINTQRLAATVAAVFVAFLCFAAVAHAQRPAGMSKSAYRALMLKSEALNAKYGLGKWAGRPPSMSPAAYRALMLRSEALNRRYGLDRTSQSTKVVAQQTSSGNGFDWGDFSIGAAAMLGLVLLTQGLLGAAYLGRRIGVRSRPGT